MALLSIKREVDVMPGVSAPVVFHVSQGDVGTSVILGLLNNGASYTIPTGVTISIIGSASNGAVFTPVSATFSGSDVTFLLSEEMSAVAGPTLCEAVITLNNDVLGTANFIINVEASPMGGDVPPVFTDAAWLWMLDKMETEIVEDIETSPGTDATIINGINEALTTARATQDALAETDERVDAVAPRFSSSSAYTKGDYVYASDGQAIKLWRFTADHAAGSGWIGTDVEEVTVGGEIKNLKDNGCGIRPDIKEALLQIARKVAYIDTDGEYYYEALYESLMIAGISAVYVQSGIVYDNDSLNSLKTDLIVTATYENGTSKTVTDYTLSGVLTVGTSNITVMYHGESATFAVNVTESPKSDMNGWSDGIAYTNLTIVQNEYAKAANGALTPYDGWDRTGYVPCDGASTITFPAMPYTGTGRNVSNWFYTENKTPLSGGTNGFALNKTEPTVITVPQDAYYYIISCARDALTSCINGGIVPHE